MPNRATLPRLPGMKIIKRAETYHLRRHVPVRFHGIEGRRIISISLKTDSLSEARKRAVTEWDDQLARWETALQTGVPIQRGSYKATVASAAKLGLVYLPTVKVAELPTAEVVDRLLLARLRDGTPDEGKASVTLGGVDDPGMTVSEALDEFWKISVDQERGKTADQVRRWKNPRVKAIGNFISVVGDKRLDQITRADASKFRDWWNERIDRERLSSDSARKDFVYVGHILRTVKEAQGLDAELPLGKLKIKATPKAERVPFTDAWIRDNLLAPGALDGLNDQARTIMLMMVNTGCRPSEVAGLMKDHIHVGGDVPHIEIKPVERELKNATSARRIPLLGASYDAAKAWLDKAPKGAKAFPEYFGRDKISATINKYLRENKLVESEAHTLYGLRHAFEDRCLRAGIDERVRRDLMGHALGRQRYGEGGGLAHVRDLLLPVAF